MKVAIIGGGISGCYAAMRIKESHPDFKVTIFEHNDKLNKKIYATGNGKCNFANSGDLSNKFNNESLVLPIIKSHGYDEISNYFNSIGIPNILEGNLAYPMSKSAQTVGMMIEKHILELGVNCILGCNIKNYKKVGNCWEIEANDNKYSFDKIIISCGGKSSPQLGSDGSIFDILSKHNYKITTMNPSLCPIKVKENTKLVDGVRSEAIVSLYEGNKLIHKEEGELLFKENGLSGIVIMNASHFINQIDSSKGKIHIDLAPRVKENISSKDYLMYVQPKLAKYLMNNNLNIHDVVFSFKGFYDYTNSHVTSGGISLDDINENLESKIEKGVYFIGEVLDVNGMCGGYNMMWCYASACRVNENI